jgi:glycosyltransferase involved in cell wall biosynthesis
VEGLPAVLEGIERVLRPLVPDFEVVVVDDGSTDGTGDAARARGARVVTRPIGMGNGAAVKAGIRASKGAIIVLMDADGQHDPEDLPRVLEPLSRGFAMSVGARSGDFGGGWHRALANRVYASLATWVASFTVPDLTSGYRAVQADVARRFVYLLPNTFSYPTTLTLSLLRCGLPVAFVPIRAHRRKGKSKIRILRDGARFLLIILRVATFFSPMRVFLPVSLLAALAGLGYYAQQWISSGAPRLTTGMQLLLLLAALLFALALIAEQVAALRFDRSEDEA